MAFAREGSSRRPPDRPPLVHDRRADHPYAGEHRGLHWNMREEGQVDEVARAAVQQVDEVRGWVGGWGGGGAPGTSLISATGTITTSVNGVIAIALRVHGTKAGPRPAEAARCKLAMSTGPCARPQCIGPLVAVPFIGVASYLSMFR